VQDELAEFCRREHARLVRALDLVCGSLPVAEDLAQETLARVCKDWSRIQHLEAPGAYAHRIAMNLATSRFRRRAAQRRADQALSGDQPLTWSDPDPTTGVVVRQALQTLRSDHRRVLVLRYFLGLSVAETAAVLRMPEGTVKTHTTRGLTALRAQLGPSLTATDEVTPHA
jgi:RNA polymerase sigma factor (sigma-70 family)